MPRQSALSTEYLRYTVKAKLLGVDYNPTADSVQFAFPAAGVAPVTGDWKAGSWETLPTQLNGTYYVAKCLVGPTGGVIALPAGDYNVYLKITDAPEVPVRLVDTLTVF